MIRIMHGWIIVFGLNLRERLTLEKTPRQTVTKEHLTRHERSTQRLFV